LDHIKSLTGLHGILDQKNWLERRYIILPNVTDGGLKTLIRTGFAAQYKEMPCVGGYVDGALSKHGEGASKIVGGTDGNWGFKKIGLFQTSDSRSDDFAKLGRHTTWVKWATPLAEALRQACLAEESRISQTEPALPNTFVSRLNVSN